MALDDAKTTPPPHHGLRAGAAPSERTPPDRPANLPDRGPDGGPPHDFVNDADRPSADPADDGLMGAPRVEPGGDAKPE